MPFCSKFNVNDLYDSFMMKQPVIYRTSQTLNSLI